MDRLRAWSPFLVSALFYAVLLAAVVIRIGAIPHGQQLCLPHSVCGIPSAEPAMASSSILWPFLLAAAGKVFGFGMLLPLILNVLFALALLVLAQYILLHSDIRSWIWQTLTLMLLVFSFPMAAMTLGSLEDVLYGFAFLLFLRAASLVLDRERQVTPLEAPGLLFSALLLTSCRYEGLFAIFIACLFLVWRSRALSIATAIAGILPILGFGLLSRSHGGGWFPQPPAVKTLDHSFLAKVFMIPLTLFSRYAWVSGLAGLVFLVFCLGVLGRRGGLSNVQRWMIFIFLAVTVLHVQFEWFAIVMPRGESYLIGAGILLASTGLYNIKRFENERKKPLLFSLKLIGGLAILPLLLYRGLWWEIAPLRPAACLSKGLPEKFAGSLTASSYADSASFRPWSSRRRPAAPDR